jgi:uncharacterized protein YndB with AHSA1/START domain
MTQSTSAPVAPVRRTVTVSWTPEAAFRHFTDEFADWWPRSSHSIGGKLVARIIFECHVGGQIIEELQDGRRFLWGTVTAFDRPHRVVFTWHPSMESDQAQDVEMRFTPAGNGTLVELISTGWERLGPDAAKMRKGYDIGWGSVLDAYAGRWSVVIPLFKVMSGARRSWLKVTGKLEQEINASGGRLSDRNCPDR